MGILEGEKITKYFSGLAALHNVDFNINQGEVVGLIGPNGAGKTTLFNVISGSIKASSGEIRYKGKKITSMKPHQICKLGIARTFQSVQLFGNLSVLDNVFLGSICGTTTSISTSDAKKKALALLEVVGLSDKKSERAKNLPIAEQKHLEIARALATEAEFLLLDEAMAGLTQTELAVSTALIKKMQNEGTTIFIVEHVMQAIMALCDRIIVLNYGVKIAEGEPEEIAVDKNVIEVYLGSDGYAEN